jgi:hypothetical protein
VFLSTATYASAIVSILVRKLGLCRCYHSLSSSKPLTICLLNAGRATSTLQRHISQTTYPRPPSPSIKRCFDLRVRSPSHVLPVEVIQKGIGGKGGKGWVIYSEGTLFIYLQAHDRQWLTHRCWLVLSGSEGTKHAALVDQMSFLLREIFQAKGTLFFPIYLFPAPKAPLTSPLDLKLSRLQPRPIRSPQVRLPFAHLPTKRPQPPRPLSSPSSHPPV